MTSNPYRPPDARVDDVSIAGPEASTRPVTVYISLVLLLLAYVQWHVRPVARSLISLPLTDLEVGYLLVHCALLGVEIASLVGIFYGRRWGPWLVVPLFLMRVYTHLIMLPNLLRFSILDKPIVLVPVAVYAVAVLLLFLHPGRRWFQKRSREAVA